MYQFSVEVKDQKKNFNKLNKKKKEKRKKGISQTVS